MESEKNHLNGSSPISLIEYKCVKLIKHYLIKEPLNLACHRAQILAHYCFYYILTIFQIACLHRLLALFADDTNISTHGSSEVEIQEHLYHDLENIHQWLLADKLTLNKEKTEYMVIGSRQRLSKISNELEIHVGETIK